MSLESEVDAYLLDMQVQSNLLGYWQVSGQYFRVGCVSTNGPNVSRRIESAFQQFFHLQWIFFLFKALPYPVRGFSHQVKRQWPCDRIGFHMISWRHCKFLSFL